MSKIKIGWLDHHFYTHHSQVFLPLIQEEGRGDFEVVAAYESDRDAARGDWCAEQGIARAESPEDVIEAADVLMVLAPNDPAAHLHLSRGALASGKPVYVDKYLSHSIDDARMMVDIARQHVTPLMTSSSLRFAPEVVQLMEQVGAPYDFVVARGMGRWRMHYGVHTIALALRAFGSHVTRVCDQGTELDRIVTLDDGARRCLVEVHECANQDEAAPWHLGVRTGDRIEQVTVTYGEPIYRNLVAEYLEFFRSGESPVSLEEQFATVAVEHAAEESRLAGGVWVDVARLDES